MELENGKPPHVVVAEELCVVNSTNADRVFRSLVDVDVFADAGIASLSFSQSVYCRKRLFVVLASLTSLCVVEYDHGQPDPAQLIDGDDVLCLVDFDVVELQSGVDPGQVKVKEKVKEKVKVKEKRKVKVKE